MIQSDDMIVTPCSAPVDLTTVQMGVDALNWTIAFLYQHGEVGKAGQLRALLDFLPRGEGLTPQPRILRTHGA